MNTLRNTRMPTDRPDVIREDDLHALLDGRLSETQRHSLEARLQHDPAAQATLQAWQEQRDSLRGLHRDVLDEPVPQSLLMASRQASRAQQQAVRWTRWGGMAASVMLAFGLGWLSHGAWMTPSAMPAQLLSQTSTGNGRAFMHQAVLAHTVYAPEVRHPVEVTAAQQEHLVQWLSKRLGKPLKVPKLSAQGFDLLGGRLLPGEAGDRAQFMFQNAEGQRVTLYLGAMATKQPPGRGETAFRFSAEGAVPGFYWVDQGFGYALSGPLSREDLLRLAEAVYHQL